MDHVAGYWPVIAAGITFLVWLIRLEAKVDDVKELKADMKDMLEKINHMNICIASLVSYFRGKGMSEIGDITDLKDK
jgi:hypothetical protein